MIYLPSELVEPVQAARDAVRGHPEHVLLPAYRLAIYRAIGYLSPPLSYYTRVWLDLVTVQRILPVWKPMEDWRDRMPKYVGLPERMLAVADRLLRLSDQQGPLAEDELWARALVADRESCREWQEWSDTDWAFWRETKYYMSACVFEAILRALHSIWGREDLTDPFMLKSMEKPFDSATTDDDIPSYSNDATYWACVAYAGGVWKPKDTSAAAEDSDSDGTWDLNVPAVQLRRQDFWNWWLDEAVAMAWHKANAHSEH